MSQVDPDQPSFDAPPAVPIDATRPSALLSLRGRRLLRESQTWTTVLASVCVLLAIVNIVNLALDLSVGFQVFAGEFAIGFIVGVSIRSILIVFLLILPAAFLWAYARQLRGALPEGREELLREAMSGQRKFWIAAALVVTTTFVLFCILLSVMISLAARFAMP